MLSTLRGDETSLLNTCALAGRAVRLGMEYLSREVLSGKGFDRQRSSTLCNRESLTGNMQRSFDPLTLKYLVFAEVVAEKQPAVSSELG